jgi:hypothetical protein
VYAIKACVVENIDKLYKNRNIYIQAAIEATYQLPDQLKTSLGLSLVKLAEHNSSADMGARATDELRVMKLLITWQDWGLHVL